MGKLVVGDLVMQIGPYNEDQTDHILEKMNGSSRFWFAFEKFLMGRISQNEFMAQIYFDAENFCEQYDLQLKEDLRARVVGCFHD
jgi:hypothetical protein